MVVRSALDAILISDSGIDSLSATNPLKLLLDGRVGDIQAVTNYIHNNGRITPPIEGDNHHSWSSAPKLNGIYLTSYLTGKKFNVELIQNYSSEKKRFSSLPVESRRKLDPTALLGQPPRSSSTLAQHSPRMAPS